jgi:anti-anti-sigma regulatory factor
VRVFEHGLEQRGPFLQVFHTSENNRMDSCATGSHDDSGGMSDRLIVPDGLDFAGRAEFTTAASRMIEHAAERIEVDCSGVTLADDPTVGMLVWLTRNARRRGLSVVLDSPTPALVAALERAGVTDRFAVG